MKKLTILLILFSTLIFSSCNKKQTLLTPIKENIEVPINHSVRFKVNLVIGKVKFTLVDIGTWSYEISAATNWHKYYYCEGYMGICSGILSSSINPNDPTLWDGGNYYFLELKPDLLALTQNGYLHISKDIPGPFHFPAGEYQVAQDCDVYYISIPKN